MTTISTTGVANDDSLQKWWRGMIRAELMLKGQPDAAASVESLLRAAPSDPEASRGRGPENVTLFSSLGDIVVRLNAATGEPITWLIERLAEGGDASASEEELIQLATQTAQPPGDAVLVEAGYETVGENVVFRARWAHMSGEVPVEGDFIEVLVNGKYRRVFKLSRRWRTPDVEGEASWK